MLSITLPEDVIHCNFENPGGNQIHFLVKDLDQFSGKYLLWFNEQP